MFVYPKASQPKVIRIDRAELSGRTRCPPNTSGATSGSGVKGADGASMKLGRFYSGRLCAEKLSPEFRLIQADMYNLFPAVGSVNAIRSNYSFEMLPGAPYSFGTCEMKIANRRAEPPERSRGEIARAMLYMEAT